MTQAVSAIRFGTSADRPRRVRWAVPARDRVAWLTAGFLVLVVLVAVLAPVLAPQDPEQTALGARLSPPMTTDADGIFHVMGTDQLGRDILSRLMFSSRVSIVVGFATVVISGALGVGLGLLAGYYGGWIDEVVMRVADVQLSFPFMLLAIAVVAVLGPNLRNVIVILGVAGWVTYARIVRAEVLSLRERDFVLAGRVIGVPDWLIMTRHLLPNILNSVIVIATLSVGQMIVAEAGLSFLGLGAQAPLSSWGMMLSEGRQQLPAGIWWPAVFPGAAIASVVLAINLFGDWLRERLDPRGRS